MATSAAPRKLYHLVLLKLKPGITQERVDAFDAAGKAMVGQISGLLSFESGPSYVPGVDRTKGFNVGAVVILEGKEHLAGYGPHPSHQVTTGIREEIAEDTLAFDFEVPA